MPGLTSTTPVRDRGPNAQLVFICTRTCSCDRGPYTKTAKVELENEAQELREDGAL